LPGGTFKPSSEMVALSISSLMRAFLEILLNLLISMSLKRFSVSLHLKVFIISIFYNA
jgi:hypothetical protein